MNHKRTSQPGFTHIKDLIDQIVGNCRLSNHTQLCEIQQIWNRMLGDEIAQHAQPASLKDGILLIYVQSPTLTHQLRFMTKEIIKQLNHLMGEDRISELKFKIRQFHNFNETRINK